VRIQVLTLRYDAARGGFDDGPLEQLVRSHRVLSVGEHFFCVDEVPHLACVVRWQEGDEGAAPASSARTRARRAGQRRNRPDPSADLDDEQRECFERLRAWRRELAQREGLPAYNLLTDRQLVAVVRARPASLESLAAVEGVGAGKARLFGEELLARLGPAPGRSLSSAGEGRRAPGHAGAPPPLGSDGGA